MRSTWFAFATPPPSMKCKNHSNKTTETIKKSVTSLAVGQTSKIACTEKNIVFKKYMYLWWGKPITDKATAFCIVSDSFRARLFVFHCNIFSLFKCMYDLLVKLIIFFIG